MHGTAGKEVKKYVLVSIFLDDKGNEAKSETDVVPDQMSYLGDRPDESSSDIRWSFYDFVGNDVRLDGEYFLYSIRGNDFYLRHKILMPEYRLQWMANGHQRLKKRPKADNYTLGEEDDGVITFKRPEEGQVEANLEATRELLEGLSTNDDSTNASIDPLDPFQRRADDEGNSAEGIMRLIEWIGIIPNMHKD